MGAGGRWGTLGAAGGHNWPGAACNERLWLPLVAGGRQQEGELVAGARLETPGAIGSGLECVKSRWATPGPRIPSCPRGVAQ